MDITLLSIIITTIGLIFTIIQITIEFIRPKHSVSIQQKNISGDRYYVDITNTIDAPTTITNPSVQNYSNRGFENTAVSLGIGLLITIILLIFYSLTYKFISAIGLLILSITIYKEIRIPFENNKAKIQWGLQKIIYITIFFILFFIPKSIEDIIIQVQPLNINSFESLLDSIIYNIKFLWDVQHDSMITALNMMCRILVTFGLILYFIVSLVNKREKHNIFSIKESMTFILMVLIIIVGSNIEFFWDLAEPLRLGIENWFNPHT